MFRMRVCECYLLSILICFRFHFYNVECSCGSIESRTPTFGVRLSSLSISTSDETFYARIRTANEWSAWRRLENKDCVPFLENGAWNYFSDFESITDAWIAIAFFSCGTDAILADSFSYWNGVSSENYITSFCSSINIDGGIDGECAKYASTTSAVCDDNSNSYTNYFIEHDDPGCDVPLISFETTNTDFRAEGYSSPHPGYPDCFRRDPTFDPSYDPTNEPTTWNPTKQPSNDPSSGPIVEPTTATQDNGSGSSFEDGWFKYGVVSFLIGIFCGLSAGGLCYLWKIRRIQEIINSVHGLDVVPSPPAPVDLFFQPGQNQKNELDLYVDVNALPKNGDVQFDYVQKTKPNQNQNKKQQIIGMALPFEHVRSVTINSDLVGRKVSNDGYIDNIPEGEFIVAGDDKYDDEGGTTAGSANNRTETRAI